jgi:hypothetical protein
MYSGCNDVHCSGAAEATADRTAYSLTVGPRRRVPITTVLIFTLSHDMRRVTPYHLARLDCSVHQPSPCCSIRECMGLLQQHG